MAEDLESIQIQLKAVGLDEAAKKVEQAIKRINDQQEKAKQLEEELARARQESSVLNLNALEKEEQALDRTVQKLESKLQKLQQQQTDLGGTKQRVQEEIKLQSDIEQLQTKTRLKRQADLKALLSNIEQQYQKHHARLAELEGQRQSIEQDIANASSTQERNRLQQSLKYVRQRADEERAKLDDLVGYKARVNGRLQTLEAQLQAAYQGFGRKQLVAAKAKADQILKTEQQLANKIIALQKEIADAKAKQAQVSQRVSTAKQQGGVDPTVVALQKRLDALKKLTEKTRQEAEESGLGALTKAGIKFKAVQKLLETFSPAQAANFLKTLDTASSALSALGSGTNIQGLSSLASELSGIAATAGGFAVVGAAIVGLAAGLRKLVSVGNEYAKQASDYIRAQNNVMKITGASRENVAGLVEAFKTVNGNAKDVADVLGQLSQATNEAARGSQIAREQFALLGVTDFSNINTVLDQLDKNFNKLPDSIRKTAALTSLFGEEGARQLTPLLGRIAEFKKLAQDAGLVMDEAATAKIEEFTKSSLALEATLQGLGNQVGLELADDFKYLNDAIIAAVKELSNDEGFTSGVKALGRFAGSAVSSLRTLIEVAATGASAIGKLVGFLADAAGTSDAFGDAVQKYKDHIRAITDNTVAFQKVTADVARSLEGLFRTTELLADQASTTISSIQATADAQVEAIQEAARQGVITLEQANQQITEIRRKALDDVAALEAQNLLRLQRGIDEQIAADKRKQEILRQNYERALALEEQVRADYNARLERQQEERLKLEQAIANIEKQLAAGVLEQTESILLRNKAALEEGLKNLRIKQAEELSIEKAQLDALTAQRLNYATEIKNLDEALRQSRVILGQEEITQEDLNNAKLLEKRKALAEGRLALQRREVERIKELLEAQRRAEEAALEARDKRIRETDKLAAERITKEKEYLAQGARLNAEYELQLVNIQLDSNNAKIEAYKQYLEQLRSLEFQNVKLIEQAERELTDLIAQQAQLKLDRQKAYVEQVLALFNRETTARQQALELEQATIEKNTASQIALNEELIAAKKRRGATEAEIDRLLLDNKAKQLAADTNLLRLQIEAAQVQIKTLQDTVRTLRAQGATEEQLLNTVQAITAERVKLLQLEAQLTVKIQERNELEREYKDLLQQSVAGYNDLQGSIFDVNASLERSQEALKGSATLAGVLAETFNLAEQKANDVATAVTEIQRLSAWLAEIEQQYGLGGRFDDRGIAQAVAEKIKQEIAEAQAVINAEYATAAAQAQAKINEAIAEEQQKLAELAQEYQKNIADIEKQVTAARRRAAKERAEAEEDAREKERREYEKLLQDQESANADYLERKAALEERYRQEDLEATKRLEEAKRKAAQDAAEDAIDRELNYLQARRDILDKIAELEKEATDKTLSQEQRKKAQEELARAQSDLAKLDADNAKKVDREKRKADAINKARQEATSAEELQIRLAKIEAEFDAEEELDKQLDALGANATEREKQRVKELIEAKKQLRLQELANEAAALAASQAQKAADRQKEIDDLKTQLEERLRRLQENYAKEKAERDAALAQRLDDIKKNLKEELRELKIQRNEIEAEYKRSVEEVKQRTQAAVDEIVKELNKIKASLQEATDGWQSFNQGALTATQLVEKLRGILAGLSSSSPGQQSSGQQNTGYGRLPGATSGGGTSNLVRRPSQSSASTATPSAPTSSSLPRPAPASSSLPTPSVQLPQTPPKRGASKLVISTGNLAEGTPTDFKRTLYNQEIIDKIPTRTDEELQQLQANYTAALAKAPNKETRDNYLQVLEAIQIELEKRAAQNKPSDQTPQQPSAPGKKPSNASTDTVGEALPKGSGISQIAQNPAKTPVGNVGGISQAGRPRGLKNQGSQTLTRTPKTDVSATDKLTQPDKQAQPDKQREAESLADNAANMPVTLAVSPVINVSFNIQNSNAVQIGKEASMKIMEALTIALEAGLTAQAEKLLNILTNKIDAKMGERLRMRGLRPV